MLIVLDNCKHLASAVADLAGRLLGACHALSILATSREVLGVDGERSWPVPPLSLPGDGAPAADALAESDAVRFFEHRAAGASVVPACRRQCPGRRAGMQAARRPAAGDRAGRGPDADAVRRSAGRAPGRPFHRAGRWRAHGPAPPPGAAGDPRLEPRPAGRGRTRGLPPAGSVLGRLHADRGRAGHCRVRHPPRARARAADPARRQVAAARGSRCQRRTVPPAQHRPRVRAGAPGRGLGGGRCPPCPPAVPCRPGGTGHATDRRRPPGPAGPRTRTGPPGR
jgi:hypothetical protein